MRPVSRAPLRHQAWLAAAAGIAFLTITALNRGGATYDIDSAVLLRLRDVHAPGLDLLGGVDDVVFRPTLTFALAIVLAAVLWRLGSPWAWSAPPFIAVTGVAEFLIKHTWRQGLHLGDVIAAAEELVRGHLHGAAPFPSGHVARGVFLGTVALVFLPRKFGIPAAVLGATTVIARMYTEAHRLSDVLGGAVLGICVACLAAWWVASRNGARTEDERRPPAELRG